MRTKSSLIFPALIIVAIYCMRAKSAAPLVNDIGLPRRDLSLLEQRGKYPDKIIVTAGGVPVPGLGYYLPDLGPSGFTIEISEAMLATNRQVLKLGIAGQAPVICELRSPCRIVVKPTNAGQRLNLSMNATNTTLSGGVNVEVFVRGQSIFIFTADEVTRER